MCFLNILKDLMLFSRRKRTFCYMLQTDAVHCEDVKQKYLLPAKGNSLIHGQMVRREQDFPIRGVVNSEGTGSKTLLLLQIDRLLLRNNPQERLCNLYIRSIALRHLHTENASSLHFHIFSKLRGTLKPGHVRISYSFSNAHAAHDFCGAWCMTPADVTPVGKLLSLIFRFVDTLFMFVDAYTISYNIYYNKERKSSIVIFGKQYRDPSATR